MIVNVEQIDPFSLPSVVLGQRSKLPAVSGIYFAILRAEVLYIGKTTNLQHRWLNHHRINQFRSYDGLVVAWIPLEGIEERDLIQLEEDCIKQFKPLLNREIIPKEFAVDNNKPTSFRLNEEGKKILQFLAEHYGVKETSVIKMLLHEKAREVGLKTRKAEQD